MRQAVANLLDKQSVRGGLLALFLLGIGVGSFTAYSNIAVLSAFALMLILTVLRPGGFSWLGFRRPSSWVTVIGLGIVLAFVFEFGTSGVIEPRIADWLGEEIDLSAFDALEGNVVNTAIMLAIGWIVGGFLEEMLFRGYLLQEIERFLGGSKIALWVGIIGTSVLFGLPHYYQDTVGMIMTGLTGFLIALTFVWSKRNLWLAVLVHGFIDTIGITMLYLGTYDDMREWFVF